MKKITFILFALIAGTGFAQNSATGTADVQAFIIQPISISSEGGMLSFGDINRTTNGGNVTVEPGANTRQFDETDMQITSQTAITSASFDIKAAEEFAYNISIASTILSPIVDATGAPMKLRPIFQLETNDKVTAPEDGAASQNVNGSGDVQKLAVGGILTVNGDQEVGAYEGTVTVTVTYE